MKKLHFFFFVLLSVSQAISQERLDLKKIGFSMDLPNGWFTLKNDEVISNLEKFDLTDEQLKNLLKNESAAVTLLYSTKYNPKKYSGIIPTIKIRTIENKIKEIKTFLEAIKSSNDDIKKSLDNFKVTEVSAVKISTADAVKLTVEFTMKVAGKDLPIISHSYYILRNGYYISLNFIEEIGKEDNSKLFEDLINSVKII